MSNNLDHSFFINKPYQTTQRIYVVPDVLTPTPTLPFGSFSAQQPQPNNAAYPQQTKRILCYHPRPYNHHTVNADSCSSRALTEQAGVQEGRPTCKKAHPI